MFSWFESCTKFRYRKSKIGTKRLESVRVVGGMWLFHAIRAQKIITYHPKYFDLGALERRIYELARLHNGRQESWTIGFSKLKRRIGDQREPRKFLDALLDIESRDPLPEYRFRVLMPAPSGKKRTARILDKTRIIFTRKEGADTASKGPSEGHGIVIDLPARELQHPRLTTELSQIGYVGRLSKVRRLAEHREVSGEGPVDQRQLAEDAAALAEALVDAGLESSR